MRREGSAIVALALAAGLACGAGPDEARARPDDDARSATFSAFAAGDPALEETRAGDRRVDLSTAAWTRDAAPARPPAADGVVTLSVPAQGTRWTTSFTTQTHGTWRARLDVDLGPDGALFEVVLDGRRLRPPRDAWRPSRRRVVLDLGSIWLGSGGHLLELVAREAREDAVLRPRALELKRLPR